MVREMSGVVARRPIDTSIGSSIEHSVQHSSGARGVPGALTLPARFQGRAQFEVDVAETVETFSAALRQVARPESVTAAAVQTYCREQGMADERMEHALLKEAFHVISREVLVERLTHAVERGLGGSARARGGEEIHAKASEIVPSGRGRTFTDHYRGMVFREGESMIVRLALGSTLEPPLAFAPDHSVRARAHRAIPVGGTLRVEGSFRPIESGSARIRVHWRVRKGADALDTRAIQSLASPLEDVVACVGAGALARFAEAIPDHLASLARADRGPAFVHLERLLRLGRVTEKTRAYLLFWRRLRDYLLWRARAEMR